MLEHWRMPILASILIAILAAGFAVLAPDVRSSGASAVLCVTPDGSSDASGDCWEDPLDLHGALHRAEAGDEIRVQQGRYFPGDNPHATFYMPDGVEIIGGYSGSNENPSERSTDPFLTVLDGRELNYTVVTAAGISEGSLNSLTIVGGAATVIENEAIDLHRRGGGLYVSNASPTFQNLLVANNRARFGGGGAYVDEGSSPTFRNVIFQGNSLTHPHSGRGGGMRVANGDVTLIDVTFRTNSAIRGGALYVDDGAVIVERSTFVENRAENQGGALAIQRGVLDVSGSRFAFNESGTEGGGLAIGFWPERVTLTGVDVIGNTSSNGGGGIQILGGKVRIDDSDISANQSGAAGGGGIAVRDAELDIRSSFIQGNYAHRGGGILVQDADSRVVNVIISGNLASINPDHNRSPDGQAPEGMPYDPLRRSITGEMIPRTVTDESDEIQLPEAGGAVLMGGAGTLTMVNSTVTGNRSDHPGSGIYRTGDNTIEVLNSIVYGNQASEAGSDELHPALLEVYSTSEPEFTTRVTIDRSIIAGGCAGLIGIDCWNVYDQNPRFLQPLDPASAPVRGGDFTLWFTSPAVDAADDSYLDSGLDRDILGNPRTVSKLAEPDPPWSGSGLDIGAVETPLREASPEREVVVIHQNGDDTVHVDLVSDRDGVVDGTIQVSTGDWELEEILPERIDWSRQAQVTLDGQATLESGHLVGFRIDLGLRGVQSEFSQYRVRLDTGVDTGWRAIVPG